jgi:hypothetical protein
MLSAWRLRGKETDDMRFDEARDIIKSKYTDTGYNKYEINLLSVIRKRYVVRYALIV